MFKQFGGLEVQTSSTQLQALTDAVLYLVAYPFECSEQLSSRVLAVAALRDVLTAFKAKGMPRPEEMNSAVARDLKRLQGMQNDDGGFGFWRRGDESWPYVSIHVAHALARAKEKGYDVPQPMLDKSRGYLRNVESHIPKRYGRDARNSLIAYALYTRALLGDRDPARARRLIAENGLEKLQLEAVGWLLTVLSGDRASTAQVAAIRRLLDNRAEETAGTAHFTTSYADDDYLLLQLRPARRRRHPRSAHRRPARRATSSRRSRADCSRTASRGAGRTRRRTPSSSLALDRYFRTYEKATPDFVARAWLGDAYAGEQQFRGRSTDRQQFDVPMSYLAEKGTGEQRLVLQKEGAGRLYYRVGMSYAPTNLKLAAADYGFAVERVYEPTGDAADVRRDADGTWHIKAGATVRVQADAGRADAPLPRRARRPAARGARSPEPGARRYGDDPRGADGAGARALLLVVAAHMVRAPEPARRARRGVHLAAVGGRLHLHLHRARDDARRLRRPARQGRGDVRPRDLRPRPERQGDSRVAAAHG